MTELTNQTSLAKFLIYAAAFTIVVAGMKAAETLLVPFFLSVFIAVICTPILTWLHNRGLPYIVAILLIISLVVVFGIAIGAVVGTSINDFSKDLPVYQEKLQHITANFIVWIDGQGVTISGSILKDILNPGIVMKMVGTTLSSLGNVMTNAFLILLTVIFILSEETVFYAKLKAASTDSRKTLAAIERFTDSINRYMALKTAFSLLTGVLIMIWLWILDVDYPALWGLLAFLLNFIPNLGSILAAVPAVLLALVQLGFGDAMLTAAGFLVVNTLVGSFLEPRFMGKGLDLSALIVFLSLVFWGFILGPVGMLLSVPLTMTLKIAFESFDDTHWISVILGSGVSEPVLKNETTSA